MRARALLGLLVALVTGALALLAWSHRLPEIDLRTDWRTALWNIHRSAPPGELLTCERDGLHRVDVAITAPGPLRPADLVLSVRDARPEGELLAQVAGSSLEAAKLGAWVSFEFEPIADSAGRRLWIQVAPAGERESSWVAPWVRFRGAAEAGTDWGEQGFPGPLVERRFTSQHPDLRGLAFGGQQLEGRSVLVLFDPATGRELRRAEADVPVPAEWGWLFFAFEPLEDSRWKELDYRLSLPPEARLVGARGEPARVAYHGSGAVDARLGGLTVGNQLHIDRDLVLRAWTDGGPRVTLALLRERLGRRLAAIALLSLAASALLCAALPASARGQSGRETASVPGTFRREGTG